MKTKLTFPVLFLCLWANAQIIDIPDANFKNALVNTGCVYTNEEFTSSATDADTNNDGEIEVSEALVVQYLKVSGANICSLSGIGSFQLVKSLDCSMNQLTALDVSFLWQLTRLDCGHNALSTLDLNNFSPALFGTLICSYNQLTALTLPGSNYDYFMCDHNLLTSISFMENAFVYESSFSDNQIATFTVPPGNHFGYLDLSDNPLTQFDITGETGFEYLTLNNTLLSFIDLGNVNSCVYLTISNNPNLTAINLVNGYFEGNWDAFLTISGNPQLNHVCVNDYTDSDDSPDNIEISEFGRVSQALASGGQSASVTYYCSFAPSGEYNMVNGTVRYGCTDAGQALQNMRVSVNGPTGSGYTYSNVQGGYSFFAGIGSYSIAPALEHPQYFNVSPGTFDATFSTGSNTENADFCLSANGSHRNLALTVIPVIPARPGFDALYKIVYENRGTESEAGTVSLTFEDAVADLVFSSPPLSGQSPNTMSWIFSGLEPFETGEIMVRLNINSAVETPAVHIGDALHFTATVVSGTDETLQDNTFLLDQYVVGSFDPNDKFVSRRVIAPGETESDLYYTVRFQNTETSAAGNIVVRDKLSDKLDPSTLQMVSASHACRATLTDGNKLEYFFQGIDLPAVSVNEPLSHGYVTYRIRPKAGIAAGDVIENTAEIFFDYNAAVITNTVTTTVSQLGTTSFAAGTVGMYPNPANQSVTFSVENTVSGISIYNSIGQIVKILPGFSGAKTFDISDLVHGTYLVKFSSDKGTASKKLVKL